MFSPPRVRPTKRRLDEIDHKIESLSEVINAMTGYEKSYMERKLLTVKLKKQKLLALSVFANAQTVQRMVAEIDMLVAENDLNEEIESIRNSKKFKRSEKLKEKECGKRRDLHVSAPRSVGDNSTSNEAHSVNSTDTILINQEIPENTPFINNNETQEDLLRLYYETINKTSLFNSIAMETSNRTMLSTEENIPSVQENVTEQLKSVRQEKTTVTVNPETDNTPPLQTQVKILPSKAPQKESKKKTSQDKQHNSRKDKNSITASSANPETPKQYFAELNLTNTVSKNKACEDTRQHSSIETLAVANKSHENVVNLHKTYKEIYSSETLATNSAKVSQSLDLQSKTKSNDNDKNKSRSRETSHKFDGNNTKNVKDRSVTLKKLDKLCKTGVEIFSNKKERSHKKSTKTKHSSHKKTRETNKENNAKESNNSKEIKLHTTNLKTTETHNTSNAVNDIKTDEKAISYVAEVIKKAMEKDGEHFGTIKTNGYALPINSHEDIVNGLFKDLMALKYIKLEPDCSSVKTTNCLQCGVVADGHMCAYTIRELLEQC